jgi:DNA-binding transcriptional MerR regulator
MTTSKSQNQCPGLRISEAAKAAGVSRQTIEYYIMLGLVNPIRVEEGDRDRRFFDDLTVRRIRLIRRLNESGYTLRDIKEIYLSRHG